MKKVKIELGFEDDGALTHISVNREEFPLEDRSNWRKRWETDLGEIGVLIDAGRKAIEDDDFDSLEDAVASIEDLVRSNA